MDPPAHFKPEIHQSVVDLGTEIRGDARVAAALSFSYGALVRSCEDCPKA